MAKVAKVRTRARGKTFSYIFEAGKVDGRRKVVEKGGFPTEDAAYKAGMEAYIDFLHGNIGIVSESVTLADFMAQWLENVAALNVKPSTMQVYRTSFKNQIAPYLGEIKVQELTPAKLDVWLRNLMQTGLARNTLSIAHALLHNALNYAVYPAQLISSNPIAAIKVPKNAPRNVIKRHIITPKNFVKLLAKYPFGTTLHIPLLLLYHTGMRLGEVLGLSWDDVDFTAKKIFVNRQLSYRNGKGYYLDEPKNETSKRYIIIDDALLNELHRWQVQQVENEKQLSDRYVYVYREEDGRVVRQSKVILAPNGEKVSLVCTITDGRLVLRDVIAKLLRKEGINSHSFRHTHTTVLAENGAPAKAIAGRLGHSNIQITQNLYTHNTLKLQEEAAAIFTKSLQTNA